MATESAPPVPTAAPRRAPAALAILVGTFPQGAERNKALGIFGGVVALAVLRRAERSAAPAAPVPAPTLAD